MNWSAEECASRDGFSAPAAWTMAGSGQEHVLIVDDLRDQTDTLALLFSLSGFATSTAYDAEAALAAARKRVPDVVVLDLVLPHMDGFLLARAFRDDSRWHETALVAYTGDASKEARRRCAAVGIDVYVLKPFDPEHLIHTVRSAARSGHVAGRLCVRGVSE